MFDQLKGLDLVSSEKLKAMVGGNAASFNAVIPQFIFEELKDQHIRYVVVEKELKTNPLSAFMELVSPIYPHAFTEKAIGLTPEGKNAILYEVAYPKI